MARQKPTDRTEARRRNRAELSSSEAAAAEAAAAEALGVPAPSPARGKAKTAAEPAPGTRLGIVEAFRLASRPADIRGDIAAFPEIARTTKAVLIPAALVVVGGVVLGVVGPNKNGLADAVIGITIAPPPTMIPAFLAGMLTRRGSWLAGLVAGLVSSAVLTLVSLTVLSDLLVDADPSVFVQAILLGPLFGAAVGAFAGFYRRFLAYSSPPRERRPSKSRPKQARRR